MELNRACTTHKQTTHTPLSLKNKKEKRKKKEKRHTKTQTHTRTDYFELVLLSHSISRHTPSPHTYIKDIEVGAFPVVLAAPVVEVELGLGLAPDVELEPDEEPVFHHFNIHCVN